jgi:hypothetical protein
MLDAACAECRNYTQYVECRYTECAMTLVTLCCAA